MKTFLIIIFFLCALQINAQDRLRTGLIIGYNSSQFIGKDKPGIKQSSLPGFYLGGIIDYPLNPRMDIFSNVALGLRGTRINTYSNQYEDVYGIYFDIPFLLKVNILIDKPVKPFVVGGFALDYNVLMFGHGPLYDIKKFDLGFVSGVGFGLKKLELSIRYNYGLTTIDNSELNQNIRSSTLSILIGIYFK
jgi:hypothetical protein